MAKRAESTRIANRVVLLLMALVVACQEAGGPSPLIGDFTSGLSVVDARARLTTLKKAVGVGQTRDVRGGSRAGGVTIEHLIVESFSHLDFQGTLELTFYNDRLVSTRFSPADVAGYRAALGRHYENHFETSRDLSIPPSTTVWFTENDRSGSFAGWEDQALISQFDVYEEN